MTERDVYHTPENKVLLRTKDVYQTEAQDDVASYSDRLLAIVADFKNSGEPEGANAQSMVGKSKRGEVACRLFARIDPDVGVIEAVGFKTRGCLAMTGCASAVCTLIQGMPIEDALDVTVDDVRRLVDGVPAGKVNALHFATCAIKGLVGDFLLREGASLDELQEAVPCDADSISCLMAEHCSYRQSLLERRMEEAERDRALAETNAVARSLDLVRENTRRGRLTKPEDWADLVPDHMGAHQFEEMVLAHIEEASSSAESAWEEGESPANASPSTERSRFASRSVGVPPTFGRGSAASEEASLPAASGQENQNQPKPGSVLDGFEHVFDYDAHQSDDDDFDLVPPPGYKLVQVDGQWGLVETSEAPAEEELAIDAGGIKVIRGSRGTYLFDGTEMTDAYAHWGYLAEEDDPTNLFVSCVREESRIYPRPMAESSFGNAPLDMGPEAVRKIWEQVRTMPAYDDIRQISASNGDVYYYSTRHLEKDHAQSLAEWASVDRYMNV